MNDKKIGFVQILILLLIGTTSLFFALLLLAGYNTIAMQGYTINYQLKIFLLNLLTFTILSGLIYYYFRNYSIKSISFRKGVMIILMIACLIPGILLLCLALLIWILGYDVSLFCSTGLLLTIIGIGTGLYLYTKDSENPPPSTISQHSDSERD